MLTYLAIAARLKPRWVVWENVPGVLSSNGGRDFGTFLGALGELGYGWAYRVLDAQYVRVGRWPRAVPQRRRRVFVVGCLGDWTAATEVLALREGLQRHLEAGGKARKGAAPDAEGGARGGCWWDGSDCAGTLTKQNANGAQRMPDKDNFGAVLQPTAYRWQNDALGLQQDDAVAALRASAGSSGFHEMNHPVIAQPVAFTQNCREEVRDLGDASSALQGQGTHQQTYIAQPVPFTKAKRAQSVTDDETWVQGQVNPTLSLFDQGDTRATTVAVSVDLQNVNLGGDVAGTLDTTRPSRGGGQAVAIGTDCYNGAITGDVAATMGTPGSSVNASGPTVMQAVAFKPGQSASAHSIGAQEGVACTLEAGGGGNNKQAVAFPWQSALDPIGQPDDVSGTLIKNQVMGVAHSLRADGFDASEDGTGRGTPLVPQAMTVRRLSAEECEALQGFSRGWTRIPWRKKPADECPDGPRYKALGNSMACNCMAWIGERIAKWEADHA